MSALSPGMCNQTARTLGPVLHQRLVKKKDTPPSLLSFPELFFWLLAEEGCAMEERRRSALGEDGANAEALSQLQAAVGASDRVAVRRN